MSFTDNEFAPERPVLVFWIKKGTKNKQPRKMENYLMMMIAHYSCPLQSEHINSFVHSFKVTPAHPVCCHCKQRLHCTMPDFFFDTQRLQWFKSSIVLLLPLPVGNNRKQLCSVQFASKICTVEPFCI